jgi:D-alanyl-D-alanine carboxypeptidase
MSFFRWGVYSVLCLVPLLCVLFACSRSKPVQAEFPVLPKAEDSLPEDTLPGLAETLALLSRAIEAAEEQPANNVNAAEFSALLSTVIRNTELPAELGQKIRTAAAENPGFILDLLICLEGDRHLRELVDKQHPLPQGYVPADLVELEDASYRVNRAGLMLRSAAAVSLEEMAAAARRDGVTLLASSAYRSYEYQIEVYNRIVREMGQEDADRESARPGFSQHQTGLVVDFGSIDNSFAETKAGRWMAANASRFGWSLSFPDGYEALTGYRWESWHYRYVGRDLAAFIDTYFDSIQQYALRFIHEWERVYSGISKTPSRMYRG